MLVDLILFVPHVPYVIGAQDASMESLWMGFLMPMVGVALILVDILMVRRLRSLGWAVGLGSVLSYCNFMLWIALVIKFRGSVPAPSRLGFDAGAGVSKLLGAIAGQQKVRTIHDRDLHQARLKEPQ